MNIRKNKDSKPTTANLDANVQPKDKKPFYKKAWFWVIVAVVLLFAFYPTDKDNQDTSSNNNGSWLKKVEKKVVADFSTMTDEQIKEWCQKEKFDCTREDKYSDDIEAGKFVSQTVAPNTQADEGSSIKYAFSLGKKPTKEQQNALRQAESYLRTLSFSKQKLYSQLTSQYGGGFSAEDAQYAIDHVKADYKAEALESAKTYYNSMNMSKQNVYQQLVSEHGEGFTPEEAQYAIDNLE